MGFLWFGTKDGLNRFDGLRFRIFRNDDFDSAAVGPNFINSLYEDPKGQLWAGTQRGLYQYDAIHEKFHLLDGILHGAMQDIQIDDHENLWLISATQLYCYPSEERKKRSRKLICYFNATSVCQTKDGTIWVSTPNGFLKKYLPSSNSFITYDLYKNSAPSPSRWINTIFATGKGFLLVGTASQGIKLFNLVDDTYKDLIIYNGDKTDLYVRSFAQYNDDEYWVATEAGIYIYHWSTGTFTHLTKQFSNPYSLSDNAVYTLCRDREGGIWAGTFFGGVNYYTHPYNRFEKYFPENGKNAIKGNAVREICEDQKGHLWIGTEDGGLNRLDKKTGSITCFNPTGEKGSIAYSNIHGLLPDGDKLWIGTFEHGLDIMDINSGKVIRHYGMRSNNLFSDFIVTLYKTQQGVILAGTSEGLQQWNPSLNKFEAVPEVPGNSLISCILQDKGGTIWVSSTGNGIYYYNREKDIKGHLLYDPTNTNSLCGNIINNIFEDTEGNMWLGSEGSGITVYNHKGNTFKHISSKNGLPSDFIFKTLEDDHKNIWITTTKGLVCLQPATGNLKVFTKSNGLLADQFNYNSGFKDSTGQMYFGSVRGMISFNPDQFVQSNFVPSVYITSLQINNKEVGINTSHSPLKQAITLTNEITLSYDQSSFSLDFAALGFTSPEMIKYAYKLKGLEKDWTYLETNRKVYFTDLSPGTYIFKLKSTDNNGIWANKETDLKIRITPPFWLSTWAYIFYTFAVILIIYLIVRSYLRRTEEKNRRKMEQLHYQKEKEVFRTKMDFYTNVAHEIRTPLTLIQGPMEKVLDNTQGIPSIEESLKIMEQNTNRLVELTDQLLDFREIETNGFRLHFSQVNLVQLLKNTYLSFKLLASQKNLQFTIDLPVSELLVMADEDALCKILNNLFSNAIKYANQKINVCLLPVLTEEKIIKMEFTNDGYIVPEQLREKIFEPFYRIKETSKQKGTGLGLSLSRSWAEMHKGKLYLENQQDKMNKFILILPFNKVPEPIPQHNR
jgi:signal transduction histidine kinase/ligand-binding sensor domain-containing protein